MSGNAFASACCVIDSSCLCFFSPFISELFISLPFFTPPIETISLVTFHCMRLFFIATLSEVTHSCLIVYSVDPSFWLADILIKSFNCLELHKPLATPRPKSEISKCRVTRMRSAHSTHSNTTELHGNARWKMSFTIFIINYIILNA